MRTIFQTYAKLGRKTGVVIVVVSCVAAFIIIGISIWTGNQASSYTISGNTLSISGTFGKTVDLSTVTGMELKRTLPARLERIKGYYGFDPNASYGFGSVIKGKCTSAVGDVTVYVDTTKPPYIDLATHSERFILGGQSKAEITTLYNQLNLKINRK